MCSWDSRFAIQISKLEALRPETDFPFFVSYSITAKPEKVEFNVEYDPYEDNILLSYRIDKVYPIPNIHINQACFSGGVNEMTVLHDYNINQPIRSGKMAHLYSIQHIQPLNGSAILEILGSTTCAKKYSNTKEIIFHLTIQILGTDYFQHKYLHFSIGRPQIFLIFVIIM